MTREQAGLFKEMADANVQERQKLLKVFLATECKNRGMMTIPPRCRGSSLCLPETCPLAKRRRT